MTTTPSLDRRPWVPSTSEDLVQEIAATVAADKPASIAAELDALITRNAVIHDDECVNLNPATNTLSPRAAAALSAGLSSRTSLGYPGAKYEMGLEAIERIEIIAAELAAEVFESRFAEVRVPSGAIANLITFMACTKPGDAIIAPPTSIGGHVTHHEPGAAGLYGLTIHDAPIDASRYSVDVAGVAALAGNVQPTLITVGASLNLDHHDVAGLRAIADDVGARLMFDAAHLSGPIAGGAWPNPLHDGAHVMTMSTYKSLGGPTAGMILTNEPELAERFDAIAFPGMTANFDAGKTAALALTLTDWLAHGGAHATAMVDNAQALAASLEQHDVPLYRAGSHVTRSHAFAIDARTFGGGAECARHLRQANLLASAIGLPTGLDDGVRVGTNELTRLGAAATDMADLAGLVAAALNSGTPAALAADATSFRQRFDRVRYTA